MSYEKVKRQNKRLEEIRILQELAYRQYRKEKKKGFLKDVDFFTFAKEEWYYKYRQGYYKYEE